MEYTIIGRIPSKKNSRRPFIRGGRVMNFPSKDYVEWHKDAKIQLLAQEPEAMLTPCSVKITITAPDNRKFDLTNKAESIMDLLVDMSILEDDNYYWCPEILLKFGGVGEPKAVIELSPAPEN